MAEVSRLRGQLDMLGDANRQLKVCVLLVI